MKIVDFIGNTVQRGNKLYWKDTQLFVDVVEIIQPNEEHSGAVVISITLPVPFDKHKPIAQLSPFIRVVDPVAEELADRMLADVKGGKDGVLSISKGA